MSDDADATRMRLDVWLWRARFYKTRGLAAAAIEAGLRIERDGQVRRVDKPATTVSLGDLLSLRAPRGNLVLRILRLPDRRGPPSEAGMCYEILDQTKDAG